MELYIYEYHRPKMAKGDEPDVAVMPRCLPRHWELFVTIWPAAVPEDAETCNNRPGSSLLGSS